MATSYRLQATSWAPLAFKILLEEFRRAWDKCEVELTPGFPLLPSFTFFYLTLPSCTVFEHCLLGPEVGGRSVRKNAIELGGLVRVESGKDRL